MSSAKLRWGILGVAGINRRLLPAFTAATTVDLRAIASRSPEKARDAAKAAGIPVAHGSYEALLDDTTIDAVYIPLPNTLHAEWTRKAAERGKHVLCEKPLCPTAGEAEELAAFCRKQGVRLMDGFMWPHHPRTHALKAFLSRGGIGELRHVTGAFTFKMDPYTPTNIRLQPDLAGGSLLDVGCYPVFGIRWAFGAEPVTVFATAVYEFGVDVALTGVLTFPDGRVGAFDCGFTVPLRGWLEVTGTTGSVWVPEMWLPGKRASYTVTALDGSRNEVAVEGEDQMVHMLDDFGRAVLEGRDPEPTPDDAIRTLRVLDALAKSARENRPVALGSR